jgi:peptide/nickel transport system substrate-binding protein
VFGCVLALASCGGSGEPPAASAPGPSARASVQPPDGVPAGTSPLPLPEFGKAYNNPQPRENIRDGGVLTLPIGAFGPNFNAFNVDGGNAEVNVIMNWLAPRLWNFTPSGDASPNTPFLLSAELVSDNPETVKFVLNPNAKWNDGTPIDWTAFDATWKLQRGGDSRYQPAATSGYESIASVEKGAAANEVVVTFKEPFYPYQYLFAEIAHPKNLDVDVYTSGWINKLPVDLLAGPFTVASLSEDRLVLERNPKWWGDTAKLEQVVFRKMEMLSSINAFQNGEIDSTNVAIADRLKQVSGMSNVQIRRGFDTRTVVYLMGRDSDLFKDEAARKAFMLGTDRKLLASINYQGLDWDEEAPGSTVMFPWQEGYRDNMPDLHYDPEQAKQVLEVAGWVLGDDGYRRKNGQLAEFTYVDFGDDPSSAALARAQQQMSKAIGLSMNIDIRKSADFAPTFTNKNFDVVIMAWSATDPFGYINICQLFCSDSESNFTGLGNKELDILLRAPGNIADPAESIAAANEAEEKALHLFGMLPLFNGPRMAAVKTGLVNVGPAGFTVPRAENIGWQKTPSDASAR